ncbi:cytochrome P450 2C20-like [Ciona intestinalis]
MPFMGEFPERVIKKWSLEKYGPIMCARMGMQDSIFLNTADAIKMAFCDNSEYLSGRPTTTIFKQVTGDKGIAIKQYGENYKIIRKFIVRTLSKYGVGKTMIENQIVEEAGLLAEFLKTKTDQPVDLKFYLYVLTSNIVSRVVCGRRYDFEDEKYHEVLINLQKILGDAKDAPFTLLIDFFPGLKHLPWFRGANNRMIERMKNWLEHSKDHIEEHKKTFDKNNLRDLIDSFLYEQEYGETENKNVYTEEELIVVVRDLFAAGSETSSNSILWILIVLLHHPHHAKTCIQEIDDVMGPNGAPSSQHRDKMPFTCAMIQETFRYRTVAPIGLQHYAQATVELGGYVIPQGTMIRNKF